MRIHVLVEDGISPQARTYAEYRLFAALSQLVATERVNDARVILRRVSEERGGDGVSCSVTVALDGGRVWRIRTTGDHAYAAINRAVDRLRADGKVESTSVTSVEHAAQ
jgi:ribosome-associated translation inhibitor RaiA